MSIHNHRPRNLPAVLLLTGVEARVPLYELSSEVLGSDVVRLVELGARVRVPSTDTSLSAFAVLTDPQGIAFGLRTRASDILLRTVSYAAEQQMPVP